MALIFSVLKETARDERRVAVSPETVKKYAALGCEVRVETGAGKNASLPDQVFIDAGAKIAKTPEETLKGAHVVLSVQAPDPKKLAGTAKGAIVAGLFNPYQNAEALDAYAKAGLTAFSMELVPRISRAQSMDVLSSQSNLAGYKSVLDATQFYGRAMPMMMTAAGTIPPARVFVMGAGVAGLQAIATAKRLGAVVSATDVRPAAKEQVESLGANFIMVESDEVKEAETAGGYAKEMSDDFKKKQAELIAETIKKQDIVITTALIPGRPAPRLVTKDMIKTMKSGAVLVDLAVETGGNIEGSKAGEAVSKDGVTIVGYRNVPSRLAADASALYAKNLYNLFTLLIDKDAGALAVNWDDEIVQGIALTRDGNVVHPRFKGEDKPQPKPAAKTSAPKKAASKKSGKSDKGEKA